jgi:hypothetical protein
MVGLLARQTLKKLRGKGMDYSQSEEKAADDIDGGGVHGDCLTLSKSFYCIDKSVK